MKRETASRFRDRRVDFEQPTGDIIYGVEGGSVRIIAQKLVPSVGYPRDICLVLLIALDECGLVQCIRCRIDAWWCSPSETLGLKDCSLLARTLVKRCDLRQQSGDSST